MSIQEHLNKIRNAISGREVRESIAKGIETAYDDASENGNANMEVKIARGTHPNLRSRLEEVDSKQQQTTAQLAHKANQSFAEEVNTKAKSSHRRIDNLIIPISAKNVNVEVTDAKVSPILNRTYDLLGQRLTDGERKLRTLETGMADISWENGHINLSNRNINRDNNIRTVENYEPYGNMTVHKENNRLAYIYIIDDNDVQRQTLTKMVTEFPKEQGKKYRFSAEGTLQNPLKIIDDVNSKEVVDSRSDFPSLNHRLTSLHDQLYADKSIDLIWEPGSISASNGLNINIRPRIRTAGFFNPFSDFYIDGGDTEVSLAEYSYDGTFVKREGYKSGLQKVELNTDRRYRLSAIGEMSDATHIKVYQQGDMLGRRTSIAGDVNDIKITSFNVGMYGMGADYGHVGKGLDDYLIAFRRYIGGLNSDIICVQEDRLHIDKGNTQSTYNDLFSRWYPYYYRSQSGWYHTKAYYSKYELNNVEFIFFEEQENDPIRNYLKATININGKEILLLNTHLPRNSESVRLANMQELKTVAENYDFYVIAGDFNNQPGELEGVYGKDKLANTGYFGNFTTRSYSGPISHIVTNLTIENCFVDVVKLSDHEPITARIGV